MVVFSGYCVQESPVLGQEELVQRLAELELNREFLHVLGDEQDWFDEDFGLSSRRHAQHKNKPRQDELTSMSAAKLPHVRQQQEEAAAMLVPHKAAEVEKLVSAALLEIWRSCGMERGNQSLTAVPKPQASETLLGDENGEQCVRSYKQVRGAPQPTSLVMFRCYRHIAVILMQK